MPVFKQRAALDIAKNIKAFVSLDVGVVRGEVPDPEAELARARNRIKAQERQLKELRERLAGRNRRLEQAGRRTAEAAQEAADPRAGRTGAQERSDDPLYREFEKRGPWVTKFVVGGKEYGGDFDAMRDTRVDRFFDCFPTARRIMELGSLEGGHTLALSGRPQVEYVLGIEGRPANVEKAKFVQRLLDATGIEFVTANLEETDLASFGEFDAVFCSGLLYHLPEPWNLIEQVSQVSPNLFVWTHYAAEDTVNATVNGLKGRTYQEYGLEDPLSGMSPDSFWPTLGGLQDMLREYGYEAIHLIEDEPNHPHGPAITLAASAR